MLIKPILKNRVENIPYSIGSILARIPYSVRLGSNYTKFKKIIESNSLDNYEYVLNHFSNIFEYSKKTFSFYRDLYKEAGVYDLKITTLKDIEKIPIITKEDIRKHLSEFNGALLLNTGGSSGEPFSFYVDKNAFAREWAHMHSIWQLKGYHYTNLKVTLRGIDLGEKIIKYNPVHNEFIINSYKKASNFKNEIIRLFNRKKIKYLHGYPSAIYNFLKELESVITDEEKRIIKSDLKACFLGSEFPMPHITSYLESKWKLDYISWYGHSEMCILAYDEYKINEYTPFFTYGLAEAVENKLIGTSFHNFDMPLIRYDTGDIVKPKYFNNGLLASFTITQGRAGDYIIDKNDKSIPLTALVFGRHHDIFNYAQFIQVKQTKPGEAIFYITTSETNMEKLYEGLNMKNIDIDYFIQTINEPFKTNAGKVKLKI